MSKELCFVIDQIGRDKGLSRDALLKLLEAALLSAAKKRFVNKPNIDLRIDHKTCNIAVFEVKTIVETITAPNEEISLGEAQTLYLGKTIGDTVEIRLHFPPGGAGFVEETPVLDHKTLIRILLFFFHETSLSAA